MNFRVQKSGFRLVAVIASPLLTLALGGVGWAQTSPGVTQFLELEGNVKFDGTVPSPLAGACEGGTNAGAPCNANSDCNSNICANFDWANGGACTFPTLNTTGTVTCNGTTPTSTANGPAVGGLFNGGVFNGAGLDPSPPAYVATDPTIVAHVFGVDQLGLKTSSGSACSVSAIPCASDNDCPGAATGETCVSCGKGDPTVYTGQGSETNNSDLNGDTYNTGSVPNKDDISNVYAISHQDALTNGFPAINEIFAGFERVVNNGDSHVDLEFLQAQLRLIPAATCKGGTNAGGPCTSDTDCPGGTCSGKPAKFPCQGKFRGHRTGGDLLLSVDYTTGGTVGGATLRKWQCNNGSLVCVGGTNDGAICAGPGAVTCSGGSCTGCDPGLPLQTSKGVSPAYSDAFVASVCSNDHTKQCAGPADCSGNPCLTVVTQAFNTSPVSCGGWACRDAAGNGPQPTLDTNEFYETGINLGLAGFTGCISSFLPHTRSSQSFTAVLKDFALLQFNTCRPSTVLTKTADKTSVVVGGSVTYTYTEKNDGNVPLTSPCPTASDKRSCFVTDDQCTSVTFQSGDTGNDSILSPGETWTFTCTLNNITQDTTNRAIGHGITTATGTAQDVTYCTCDGTRAGVACDDAHACSTGSCTAVEPKVSAAVCDVDEFAKTTVTVVTPDTCLIKKVASKSVSYSTTVTYTYAEKNEGTVKLDHPSVEDMECTTNGGTVSLQTCGTNGFCSGDATVACTLNHDCSGDANDNGTLDPGETFHFQCTATFTNVAGAMTDTAIAHGCFTSGGVTKDVTISSATAASCGTGGKFVDADESDQKTVTITAPAVSVSGGKASCP